MLLFSFKSFSQNTLDSTNNIIGNINASGTDATSSSGSVVYSIGQVFYTYIEATEYTVAQGIQHEDDPVSVAGTISQNQVICSNSQPASVTLTGNIGTIQWQSSTDNLTFTNIDGETANTLSDTAIGILTTTKYFRAVVTNGVSPSVTSETVEILISTTTWNGSTWDNGAPTSTTSAIISGNYNVSEDINACSLTVNNNAVVTIPSGYNVTLNGAITVDSGSFTLNDIANLIQLTDVANSGNITVNRNSAALLRLDYTLWSSPVTNDSLYLQAFSPATNTNRFYNYSTLTNLYTAIASPSTTKFGLGQGYLIRMPNDASSTVRTNYLGVFTGVPNNGNIPISMINGGEGKRFNLIGNPYPSPVNVAQFVADNAANITGTLYFWRKTNNAESPSYCTMVAGTFIWNGESQVEDPKGIIQSGQGFFVEALNSATTVVFNNGQRTAVNTNQFFKTKAIERNTIWLNATNTTGAFSQMAVGYITDATLGVDEFDGKHYNDGAIALNSFLDNTDYVIQGRPLPFDGADVVPLSFKATNAGDYTIAIDHVDGLFTSSQDIILKDSDNGIETNLKLNSYTFSAPAGRTNSRFSLKYQKTLGIATATFDENSVVVFQNQGKINIKLNVSSIDNVKLYDIRGRLLVEKTKVNANETSIESSKYANQVLIVKITSTDDKVLSKKIVN
ncbi:MAG TPA: T9SS sorting signal type C domain-containing protein [Flavobacterium sp.]|nr:T9SS sorting signal type C domain-containing protein [Flavobacterium sp.]